VGIIVYYGCGGPKSRQHTFLVAMMFWLLLSEAIKMRYATDGNTRVYRSAVTHVLLQNIVLPLIRLNVFLSICIV